MVHFQFKICIIEVGGRGLWVVVVVGGGLLVYLEVVKFVFS